MSYKTVSLSETGSNGSFNSYAAGFASKVESTLNEYANRGWEVVSVTSNHSVCNESYTSYGQHYERIKVYFYALLTFKK